MAKIMVVDDEQQNLKLIKLFLRDSSHELLAYDDSLAAWSDLEAEPGNIDLILLDRMMPNLDGMEFVRRLKQLNRQDAPLVIMQTAAAESDRIAEGLAAGIYYYLTKPFDQAVLRTLVDSACLERKQYKELRAGLDQFSNLTSCLQQGRFAFRTIQQATDLARALASVFPDPGKAVTGLNELMMNAVEHGNLAISYEEKSRLLEHSLWHKEIDQRLLTEPYKHRQAHIEVDVKPDQIEATICDEGAGFDWSQYLEPDPVRMMDAHGRGILMARGMSFDEMEYKGTGSVVVVRCFRNNLNQST